MGKKHKKFKKKMLKEMQKLAAQKAAADHIENTSKEATGSEIEISNNQAVLNHPGASAFSGLDREYNHVKKDVLKIIISLASILILLLIFYYINQKTGILTGLGDWAYKVSNIHTQ